MPAQTLTPTPNDRRRPADRGRKGQARQARALLKAHQLISVVSRQGEWGHFALSLVTAGALIVVIALAAAHFLDPYDTGRSPLVQRPGVRPQGPRQPGGRGRDLAFNAAVFGNSRIQLLSPERLNGITGLSFVQLSVPGTGPKEQLTLIQWFMRHHPDARALVIGADKNWCTADPAMRVSTRSRTGFTAPISLNTPSVCCGRMCLGIAPAPRISLCEASGAGTSGRLLGLRAELRRPRP